MKTQSIKNVVSWIFSLTPLWALVLVVMVMIYSNNKNTVYKTTVVYEGTEVEVSVKKDKLLAFCPRESLVGIEVFLRGNKVMRKSGLFGSRGHLPIVSITPASSGEIALYRQFFPL